MYPCGSQWPKGRTLHRVWILGIFMRVVDISWHVVRFASVLAWFWFWFGFDSTCPRREHVLHMFGCCHNEYRYRIGGAWAWLIARQSEAANQTRIKSEQQEQVNNSTRPASITRNANVINMSDSTAQIVPIARVANSWAQSLAQQRQHCGFISRNSELAAGALGPEAGIRSLDDNDMAAVAAWS